MLQDLRGLLLHICCAPCLIYPLDTLFAAGEFKVTGYFDNPNIQPYAEYQARRTALVGYAAARGLPLILKKDYGFADFLAAVAAEPAARCLYCYESRLAAVAIQARLEGCTAFSTTLLYSKYQKHELIKEVAERVALKYDVVFYYEDWRSGWEIGRGKTFEAGLYRQKYCGCIYSEYEAGAGRKKKRDDPVENIQGEKGLFRSVRS